MGLCFALFLFLIVSTSAFQVAETVTTADLDLNVTNMHPSVDSQNWIDMHWIMSAKDIRFTGFFVELLGFSSSLARVFPLIKLSKSFYGNSFDENLFGEDSFLETSVFPSERNDILELINDTLPDVTSIRSPRSRFVPEVEIDFTTYCSNSSSWHRDVLVQGKELSRSRPGGRVVSPENCCLQCARHPSCISWSFQSYTQHDNTNTNNARKKECRLHRQHYKANELQPLPPVNKPLYDSTAAETATSTDDTPYYGTIPIGKRYPKPRVIIMHGTNCIFRNETIATQRDIDTIVIGRYMLERADLLRGISTDEYAVTRCMHFMDELWVPTEWHRELFAKLFQRHSSKPAPPITVIGEVVNTNLFAPLSKNDVFQPPSNEILVHSDGSTNSNDPVPEVTSVPSFRVPSCDFSEEDIVTCDANKIVFDFLSIFKWERRKGWDILLLAYIKAFSAKDAVRLRIYTHIPSSDPNPDGLGDRLFQFFAENFPNTSATDLPRIQIFETPGGKRSKNATFGNVHLHTLFRPLSRMDMRQLYSEADSFVLPTRGEGWGLPIAEAMSMALPVIVTDAPGPRAFTTSETAYILSIEDGQNDEFGFVQPKLDHLIQLLHQVVRDSSTKRFFVAQKRGQRARQYLIQGWQSMPLVRLMDERIRHQIKLRGWEY